MVGATEAKRPEDNEIFTPSGQRWLEVQLVGESYGRDGFQRGVSVFPTLDDEAHIVTEDDLALIYGMSGDTMVQIGTLAASENLTASVDLDKIVTRHAAILGSTGSGKSNTVAGFLKALVGGSFPNARVVVIDPHGEYGAALKGHARVYSINDPKYPLVVPYWALSFDELAWFLVDRRTSSETLQDSALRDYVFELKRTSCTSTRSGKVDPDEITVDSPLPFSLREVWYNFDRKERVTYEDMGRTKEALEKEGDASSLTAAKFKPPSAGSAAPFKPNFSLNMGSYLNKLLGRIKDKKFRFLIEPGDYDGVKQDLDDLLASWIDHEQEITVLDLAGIPFEVTDLIVGVVTRILFEGMFWGRDIPGSGRQRPILVVYEEAHGYLPRGGASQFITGYAGRAVRRIFKEGRKYGIGAIIVSQRPSELDETILSQCGTFFALRLSNSDDQGRIKSTVPDALAGLIDLLPALRTGEALVLGEAVKIPSRVRLPLIEPRPKSDDPEPAKRWSEKKGAKSNYALAITGWRRQRLPDLEGGEKSGTSAS